MFIDQNAFAPAQATSVKELRAACVGCSDCKGLCFDRLQFSQLPEILLAEREANL